MSDCHLGCRAISVKVPYTSEQQIIRRNEQGMLVCIHCSEAFFKDSDIKVSILVNVGLASDLTWIRNMRRLVNTNTWKPGRVNNPHSLWIWSPYAQIHQAR